MKVLILGLGSIGRRHGRCFGTAGVDAIAGFDPDPERRAAFTAESDGQVFSNEADGLAWKPDLVVIASPNTFHLRQAMLVAAARTPMFIEKPLGTDLGEARALGKVISGSGLYAHVGSNWKFHPAFKLMRAWIDAGRIGRLAGVQALAGQWLPDWHPWEDYRFMYAARRDLGGGAVFDTHELDYMTWLAGPVTEFCGFKSRTGSLQIDTEDVAACLLRFQCGALGVLLTDYIQRVPRRRYHLCGTEGSIEWDYADGHVVLHQPGKPTAERVNTHLDDINDMYLAQARRVLDDLRSGSSPETPVTAMLRILELQTIWHAEQQSACGRS